MVLCLLLSNYEGKSNFFFENISIIIWGRYRRLFDLIVFDKNFLFARGSMKTFSCISRTFYPEI